MKKLFATIIALTSFATPLSVMASTQVFMANSTEANLGNGFSNFDYGIGGAGSTLGSTDVGSLFPVAGTLSNLTFYVPIQPGGSATRTGTLRKNSTNTTMTCTIAAGSNSCTDSTNSISFAVGDDAKFRESFTGTPAASNGSWSFVFTPTVPNDTVFFSTAAGSSAYGWRALNIGGAGLSTIKTGRFSIELVMPEAGTLDQLQASTTNIVSGSYLISAWQNSATSTLQCTVQSPDLDHCGDTSNSLSVAIGDLFQLGQAPASPGANFKGGFGTRFVPATAGNFDLLAGAAGAHWANAGTTGYLQISSARFISNPYTTEASTTAAIAAASTFTSMTIERSAAPGSGKNATYTLRVNGADSALTCTLTGTGTGDGKTTKTCTGNVSVQAGDLINWSETLGSGGTVGGTRIGLVAQATVAAANTTPSRHMRLFQGFKIKIIGGKLKLLQN